MSKILRKIRAGRVVFAVVYTPCTAGDSPKARAQKQKASTAAREKLNARTSFQKLELRVGTILEAGRVPKADKLLCFKIDLGEAEPRQILSGIAEHFEPETLVGRQVCVVANLAPRKIRGLVSAGMILTAETPDGKLTLLAPGGDVAPGSKIS